MSMPTKEEFESALNAIDQKKLNQILNKNIPDQEQTTKSNPQFRIILNPEDL